MNSCEDFYNRTTTEIEIILESKPFLLAEAQQITAAKDLRLGWDTDRFEQYIFSAYSPHIESLDDPKRIVQRTLSLLLLFNGSRYISYLNLKSHLQITKNTPQFKLNFM